MRPHACTRCAPGAECFAPGAKPCTLCNMVSRPESQYCDNRGRGCPGSGLGLWACADRERHTGVARIRHGAAARGDRPSGREGEGGPADAWRAGGRRSRRRGAREAWAGDRPSTSRTEPRRGPRGAGEGAGAEAARGGRARPDELTGRPGAPLVGGVAGPRTCASARDAHARTVARADQAPPCRLVAAGAARRGRQWLRQANLRAGLRGRPRATRRPQAAASWSS